MTRRGIRNLTSITVCLLIAGMAYAEDLGAPAKPLAISEWIKGSPVDLTAGKGKNVYVVEFWATWCPPCRASIPHLTDLQKEYKDKNVVVIGVTGADRNGASLVGTKSFVEKMGDKMNYTVAFDDGEKTRDVYMKAYDQDGIPCAFVIDKNGTVGWIDNPAGDDNQIKEAIDAALAGKLDDSKRKELKANQAEAGKKWERLAKNFQQYKELVSKPDPDKAKVQELGETIVKDAGKNAMLLNELAWNILTDEDVKWRDKAFALKVAEKADGYADHKDPAILDTLAKAQYENGKVSDAIRTEKKALELASGDEMKELREELQKALDEYQKAAQK